MDANEKWYSVKEVGSRLGFGEDTIRRSIKAGQLRAFKLPGRSSKRVRSYQSFRISESELQRFIRTGMTAV